MLSLFVFGIFFFIYKLLHDIAFFLYLLIHDGKLIILYIHTVIIFMKIKKNKKKKKVLLITIMKI